MLDSFLMWLRTHLISQISIDAGPPLDLAVATYLIVFADSDRITSTAFRMRLLYWVNHLLCKITYIVRTGIASGTRSRQCHPRRGAPPEDTPPIFERLKIKSEVWYELVTRFGKLFSLVAGQPHRVDEYRGRLRKKRYHLRQAARELLSA